MTAGIQIMNDAGTIQIDENFCNLCVRAKVSGVIPSSGTATQSIPNNFTAYRVMARRLSAGIQVGVTVSGSNLDCTITGPAGGTYTLWFFDVPTNPSNYGLVVYRSDGSLAFDATKQHMRMIDTMVGSDFTGVGSRSYPAGRTYATICSKFGFWRRQSIDFSDGMWHTSYENKKTLDAWNGQTLSTSVLYYTEEGIDVPTKPPTYVLNDSQAWAFMVVDVTGY